MKKVAILGGTGNIGEGLARRICLGEKFDVEIGSRGAEKAEAAAEGVCTKNSLPFGCSFFLSLVRSMPKNGFI